jgi:hypothetical protein
MKIRRMRMIAWPGSIKEKEYNPGNKFQMSVTFMLVQLLPCGWMSTSSR